MKPNRPQKSLQISKLKPFSFITPTQNMASQRQSSSERFGLTIQINLDDPPKSARSLQYGQYKQRKTKKESRGNQAYIKRAERRRVGTLNSFKVNIKSKSSTTAQLTLP